MNVTSKSIRHIEEWGRFTVEVNGKEYRGSYSTYEGDIGIEWHGDQPDLAAYEEMDLLETVLDFD